MENRIFATAFGPFGSFDENPSSILVPELGLPFEILPVTFAAVDEFVSSDRLEGVDTLVMFGVAGKGTVITLETTARNVIGSTPDADGQVHGPGPVDANLPPQLASNLWTGEEIWSDPDWVMGVDAGGYLCNYLFFSVLSRRPNIRAGFVHIPPFEAVPAVQQAQVIDRLVSRLKESPGALLYA